MVILIPKVKISIGLHRGLKADTSPKLPIIYRASQRSLGMLSEDPLGESQLKTLTQIDA